MFRTPFWRQECFAVFPSQESDFFYMNMRVYRIERAARAGRAVEKGPALIWCAMLDRSSAGGNPKN